MSQLPALADVLDETAALNGLTPRNNGFHLEPRCRVCRNDTLRIKVNNLLASGASYAMILRALGDDNATLDKPDLVTIDSIRNHTARHFPVQNVAKAGGSHHQRDPFHSARRAVGGDPAQDRWTRRG